MIDTPSYENREQLEDLLKKGSHAYTQRKFDIAGQCCQEALQLEPELVPAHFLVGLIALGTKNKKLAFRAFQTVVKLDNDHVAAWAQLAYRYMTRGMVNLADKALQEVRRIRTDDPTVLTLIGTTLSLMGENDLAKSAFGRAYTLAPENIEYTHNLASNLVHQGDTDTAEILLKSIIEKRADSPQAHWSLSLFVKAKDNSHIEKMNKLCQENKNKPTAQAFYQYAIGKEYEDQQNWDKAFEAFSKGAAATRSKGDFDEAGEIETFDYLTENFTEEWLENSGPGIADASPIFVLGQPRTGTTLIERIITSHSDVHSAGELQQFPLAMRRLGNTKNPQRFSAELFDLVKEVDGRLLATKYLQTSGRMLGSKARYVDKLPANYLNIPLILKALPNAKIVHLIRDPMDACFSSYKQLFANAYLHSYNQEEMARHHVRYLKLMQVWRERFPGRFFDISYEETARNLEPNARALIDYLELPWQDECLNFHQQKTAVTTASTVQVREPAHTRSIGRWRKYEQQLQPMLTELQAHGIKIEE
ncbi:sulfotransferase [Thalassotalea psychrophila]|uniref:Sulfotransferase n=1 Tax=Thalassotalea psychrophila TaxID=3065647 RepID=A0ABY9TW39_9GAMM|nr:sulfotransferase [Colwelliaceae bacterium SQ149]